MGETNEPSPADRKRFTRLFRRLDVNKDGAIEAYELEKALKALRVPEHIVSTHAKVCILCSQGCMSIIFRKSFRKLTRTKMQL